MAAVSQLYQSTGSSLPFDWMMSAQTESDAGADAFLQKVRMQREFASRTLPGIANRFAARGTFFSGTARRTADEAREDKDNNSFDVDRMLARTRDNLARNRILAAGGLA